MSSKESDQEYFSDILDKLTEFSTAIDLVRLGIFSSESTLSRARSTGHVPDYIEFSPGKIRYPRLAVVRFLKERLREGKRLTKNFDNEEGR